MSYLKWFLFLPVNHLLPNCLRVWNLLIIVGVIPGIFVGFLMIRNPGGRNFDNRKPVDPALPCTDIDKPTTILNELQASFNSNATRLTPIVLYLARACDAVYASGETSVPRLFFDTKFDKVVPISSGPNAAIIGLKDKIAIVVFRGTDETKDWYTNLNSKWAPVEHGKLHSGFWSAYLSLKEEIVKTLSSRDLQQLWICGHSLGGAMALCCGYDFTNKTNFPLSGIITFGQPKLADGLLASHLNKALNGKYLAVIADKDPVTETVPFCHFCGNAVWFYGDKAYFDGGQIEAKKNIDSVFESGSPELGGVPFFQRVMTEEKLSQMQEKLRNEERPPSRNQNDPPVYGSSLPFFRDHNMSNYIAKLRAYFALNATDMMR